MLMVFSPIMQAAMVELLFCIIIVLMLQAFFQHSIELPSILEQTFLYKTKQRSFLAKERQKLVCFEK